MDTTKPYGSSRGEWVGDVMGSCQHCKELKLLNLFQDEYGGIERVCGECWRTGQVSYTLCNLKEEAGY